MVTTILFVTFAPITNYLGNGLQIDTLIQNNYNVKILDISALFNFQTPIHAEKYKNLGIKIHNLNELEATISKHNPSETLVNVQLTYEWRFRKIFRLITQYNQYNFSFYLFGQLPAHPPATFLNRIRSIPFSTFIYKFVTRVLSKILFKISFFSHQNIIFYAGECSKRASSGQKLYPINHFDYDSYLEDPIANDDNYIVFLDDGLFQHPDDHIIGNIVEASTLESYQKSLNNFFDRLETETKFKIIIAAHPKVNHHPDFFQNRTVVKHNTQKLVKNASMVLCHSSTSVCFAVCYKKPILFLINNTIFDFSKKFQRVDEPIQSFAKHLARPLINMDDSTFNFHKYFFEINVERYEEFKLNYLTTKKSFDKLSKDLLIKYIQEI